MPSLFNNPAYKATLLQELRNVLKLAKSAPFGENEKALVTAIKNETSPALTDAQYIQRVRQAIDAYNPTQGRSFSNTILGRAPETNTEQQTAVKERLTSALAQIEQLELDVKEREAEQLQNDYDEWAPVSIEVEPGGSAKRVEAGKLVRNGSDKPFHLDHEAMAEQRAVHTARSVARNETVEVNRQAKSRSRAPVRLYMQFADNERRATQTLDKRAQVLQVDPRDAKTTKVIVSVEENGKSTKISTGKEARRVQALSFRPR